MGGKRRRSGGGGIRKKARSKQTLLRVEERKEAQQEKLERKLAAAEAATRRVHPLLAKPRERREQPQTETVHVQEPEKEDPAKARYAAKKAHAYHALVGALADSKYAQALPQDEQNDLEVMPSARRDVDTDAAHCDGVEKAKEAVEDVVATGDEQKQEESLERENAAAMAREKTQFDSRITPAASDTAGKLKVIATLSGLARVSACAPEERRTALEEDFAPGLQKVSARMLGLQPSVYMKWRMLTSKLRRGDGLTETSRAFLLAMRGYHDVSLYSAMPPHEEDQLRRLYVAHCVGHVLRARARVLRNDALLRGDQAVGSADATKDQGFCRARVLLLVPMKNVAYEIVRTITALAVGTAEGEKGVAHVANSERFEAEFAPDPGEEEGDDEPDHQAVGHTSGKGIETIGKKPSDHRHTFRGNIEDDFKLGISFTKKTVRLYADFYASDVIIASPLGLRRGVAEKASGDSAHKRLLRKKKEEEDGDTEWKTGIGAEPRKRKESDEDDGFLSSIEVCVIDGAHIFSMQNWDSLRKVGTMVNKMPSSTRDTDFSRLREWCLDGLMNKFRQTIVLSQHRTAEIVSFTKEFSNHAGRVQILDTSRERGMMSRVAVSIRQTFLKVPEVESPTAGPESRFSFFFKTVFPTIRSITDSQTIIFIPSYFDYVRVRNKLLSFAEDDAEFRFASICEYSKQSDVSRARAKFYDRSISVVLMTERFHFFRRHRIRGANTIVWYGLPENSEYYAEVTNMTAEAVESGKNVQAIALYDMYDAFRLDGVVGQDRRRRMASKRSRSTYLFV